MSDNSDGDIKKGAASALNPHPFGFPYLLVTDDKETPKEKIRDILDE
ncbi:MAG: hypothetical protein LBD15_01950 [Holosporales bacterium]|nr:hypothetical protein [Holosporales bacterium]